MKALYYAMVQIKKFDVRRSSALGVDAAKPADD